MNNKNSKNNAEHYHHNNGESFHSNSEHNSRGSYSNGEHLHSNDENNGRNSKNNGESFHSNSEHNSKSSYSNGKHLHGNDENNGRNSKSNVGNSYSNDEQLHSHDENNTETCLECSTVFTPSRKGQSYCSSQCNNRARQRRYRESHQGTAGMSADHSDESDDEEIEYDANFYLDLLKLENVRLNDLVVKLMNEKMEQQQIITKMELNEIFGSWTQQVKDIEIKAERELREQYRDSLLRR